MVIDGISKHKNKILNIAFYLLIAIIIFFGIFIRLKFYLAKLPMWLDEVMLASSFVDRSFSDLFMPLEAFQKAPPLFFVSVLALRKLFGINEFSLRFIPFILGAVSILPFFLFLKENIKNKFGIIIGLMMFAFSVPLVYFSAEFKPYGCDVFFCLILFISYKYIDLVNLSLRRAILYSIASILFIFSSFTTIFIIPAMIFTKFFEKRKISYKVLLILGAVIFAGLFLCFKDFGTYKFLHNYWGEFEGGFPTNNYIDFIFRFIYKACIYYIYHFNIKYVFFILILTISGGYLLFKDKKEKFILITLVFLFTLIASFINAYPLTPKLALYLYPLFILLLVKNFDISVYLEKLTYKTLSNVLLMIGLFFLIGFNIPYLNMNQEAVAYYNVTSKGRNKNIMDRVYVREYCLQLLENYKNKDPILVSEEFIYSLNLYNAYYGFKKDLNMSSYGYSALKKMSDDDLEKYVNDFVKKNAKTNNIWFIGRNFERNYFISPSFDFLKSVLDEYKLKYTEHTVNNMYMIHVENNK